MAISVFLCTFLIFNIDEPEAKKTSNEEQIKGMVRTYELNDSSRFEFIRILKVTIFECLVCPFKIFMKRNDWKKLIVIIVLFKAGDIMAQKMAKPFYVELGFSMLEIANVVQVFGTIAALIGGIIGGYLVKNAGIKTAMLYTAIANALSCFAYVALSTIGYNMHMLYVAVFMENITGGAMGTAFIAFLYSLCDKQYCATQYALLWAFYDCGGIVCRTLSGAIADTLGWTNFFLFIPLAFIPSILLLQSMVKREVHGK
jgi:PAT family beta-lactamase induction signal transducer AmpG